MCADKATSNAKFVLDKLERVAKEKAMKEINRRDIYMACRSTAIKEPKNLDDPLDLLIEYNYLREKSTDDTTQNVGRKPSSIYVLNPLYFENEKDGGM